MRIIEHLDSSHCKNHITFHLILSLLFGLVILTMGFGQIHLQSEHVMDSEYYYGTADFYRDMVDLGQEGRISYLFFHLFDYLFMMHFYPFLLFLCVWLFKKVRAKKGFKYLSLLPVIPWISDFLENLCIDVSLLNYPLRIRLLGKLSGYFTFVKWNVLFVIIALMVVLVFLVFRRRKQSA